MLSKHVATIRRTPSFWLTKRIIFSNFDKFMEIHGKKSLQRRPTLQSFADLGCLAFVTLGRNTTTAVCVPLSFVGLSS